MDMIADALLLAGALSAAFYCWILSKRVKSLTDLDSGLGSAIAGLSSQVSDMQAALRVTQSVTGSSVTEMEDLANRAERAAENLKLMLATVHEEKEPVAKRSARVRKFPKPSKVEPDVVQEEGADLDRINTTDQAEAKVEQLTNADTTKRASQPTTRAEKLQQTVADRLSDREESETRDELVQALQSILAANK